MAKLNKPTHMTYGSVLDDLGFSPEKAAVLKMKAEIGARLTSRMSKGKAPVAGLKAKRLASVSVG